MPNWKSDAEVYEAAEHAARKIIELVNSEGNVWLPGPEAYPGGAGANVVTSMRLDAEDFLSLDPQKIIDEYGRMQKVASDINPDASTAVVDSLDRLGDRLDEWYGAGADAFKTQVSKIHTFIGQQMNYTVETLRALWGLYALAVQARADYCSLAQATAAAAENAIKKTKDQDTKFAIQVGVSAVSATISAISGGSLLVASVSQLVSLSGTAMQNSVEGDASPGVIQGYNDGRQKLLANYEESLDFLKSVITGQHDKLLAEPNELFAPLPSTTDVSSPDFSYGAFFSKDRDTGQFSDRVNEARKKYAAEQQPGILNPDSPIQRRLEG